MLHMKKTTNSPVDSYQDLHLFPLAQAFSSWFFTQNTIPGVKHEHNRRHQSCSVFATAICPDLVNPRSRSQLRQGLQYSIPLSKAQVAPSYIQEISELKHTQHTFWSLTYFHLTPRFCVTSTFMYPNRKTQVLHTTVTHIFSLLSTITGSPDCSQDVWCICIYCMTRYFHCLCNNRDIQQHSTFTNRTWMQCLFVTWHIHVSSEENNYRALITQP